MDRNKLLTALALDTSCKQVHWESSLLNDARGLKAILYWRHALPSPWNPGATRQPNCLATLVAIAQLQYGITTTIQGEVCEEAPGVT